MAGESTTDDRADQETHEGDHRGGHIDSGMRHEPEPEEDHVAGHVGDEDVPEEQHADGIHQSGRKRQHQQGHDGAPI